MNTDDDGCSFTISDVLLWEGVFGVSFSPATTAGLSLRVREARRSRALKGLKAANSSSVLADRIVLVDF